MQITEHDRSVLMLKYSNINKVLLNVVTDRYIMSLLTDEISAKRDAGRDKARERLRGTGIVCHAHYVCSGPYVDTMFVDVNNKKIFTVSEILLCMA